MTMRTIINAAAITLAALLLAACSPADEDATPASQQTATERHHGAEAVDETMVVYMTPWCGCCQVWADQSVEAGFEVEIRKVEALHPVKERLGVPIAHGSCHTAKISGYFIEGHVPFADIRRLLAEQPEARGLTVPGMPIGSPGMEQGDYRQAYDVYLIEPDGSATVFSHYPEMRP